MTYRKHFVFPADFAEQKTLAQDDFGPDDRGFRMDILNRHHSGRKKGKNKKKASPASKRSSALFKQQSASAPGGSTPAPSTSGGTTPAPPAPGGSGLFDYNSSATLELDAEAFYDIPIDSNLLDEWFLPDPEDTDDPAPEETAPPSAPGRAAGSAETVQLSAPGRTADSADTVFLTAPGRTSGSAAAPQRAAVPSPARTYQTPAKENNPRTSSYTGSSPSASPDEAGHTAVYFSPLIHAESAGKDHRPGPEFTTQARTSANPDIISRSHRDRTPDQTPGMHRGTDTGKAADTHRSTDADQAADTHRSTDTDQPAGTHRNTDTDRPGRTDRPASESMNTAPASSSQQKRTPPPDQAQDPAASSTAPARPKAPAQAVSRPHTHTPVRMAQAARSGPENILDLVVTIAGIALCIFAILYFHIRLAGKEPLTGTGTGAIQSPSYETVICDSGAPEHDETVTSASRTHLQEETVSCVSRIRLQEETVSCDPGASAHGQTTFFL